ncbi:MAG: HDOD domain-containing protein, partial [Zetaproteobacteria bacterium]
MDKPYTTREETIALVFHAGDPPTLPERFHAIQAVIQDPDSGAEDLARVIGEDQATSSVIMRMSMSAFYNPMGLPVYTLPEAIARIGMQTAAQTALSMSLIYGLFAPIGIGTIRRLWAHAWAVAIIAAKLDAHPAAYMAGLLHDLGKVMLGLRVDMEYFESELGRLHGEELT